MKKTVALSVLMVILSGALARAEDAKPAAAQKYSEAEVNASPYLKSVVTREGVMADTSKYKKSGPYKIALAAQGPTNSWAALFDQEARYHVDQLGACLLNPGEMGFEPLKPVGEPDAANSRIRFDVRVEALRPSFVAPFPRWRSSAGCECGKGRGPPLGELQDIVGEADEAPLVGDLLDAAQEKLTEAARLLDLSEHRLGQLLS